jgi:hypothetical protein
VLNQGYAIKITREWNVPHSGVGYVTRFRVESDGHEGEACMSWAVGEVWRLCRGEQLLGEIHLQGGDFPWVHGTFQPRQAFAEVKPWFDEELALVESHRNAECDAVYHRITGSLSLVAPDGPVAEFLLHIRGDEAWFRWSDEPFDERQ